MAWSLFGHVGISVRMFKNVSLRLSVFASWLCLGLHMALASSPTPETNWRVGDRFHSQLDAVVGVTWEKMPLREALDRLARLHSVAIFLDRHIDPGQPISLQLSQVTLDAAIRRVAKYAKAEVGYVGPVVYVGPSRICQRLATLAEIRNEEASRLSPPVAARLRQRTPLRWDDLSEPRQIIGDVVTTAGLRFDKLEAIPHDLWRGRELPSLTTPEKLTLLLAGFRVSYRIADDEKSLQLTRFPDAVSVERKYSIGSNAAKLAQRLSSAFAQAEVVTDGEQLIVRSTLEDHWTLAKLLRGHVRGRGIKGNAPAADKRYTVTVVNKPLRPVVATIARQLDLDVEFAEEVGDVQDRLISFSVEQVTVEELITAMLKPVGLRFDVQDDLIRILPADTN